MRTAFILFLICCVSVVGMFPKKTQAHPHVFVDASLNLAFDNTGLQYLDVVWDFDEMSSDLFIMDLDTDGDGILTKEEWKAQRTDIEGYLREQNFFVHVVVNGQKLQLTKVVKFIAQVDNEKMLSYSMRIPLNIKDTTGAEKVQIAIYDPSYYTDFYTALDAVSVAGRNDISLFIDDAPDLAFYQGQIIPTAVTFEF